MAVDLGNITENDLIGVTNHSELGKKLLALDEKQILLLFETCESTHPDIRLDKLAFAFYHLRHKPSIPALCKLLKQHSSEEIRFDAVTSILMIAAMKDSDEAVSALKEAAINDASEKVRFEAIRALGHVRPRTDETVSFLVGLLEHENPRVSTHAKSTLLALGKSSVVNSVYPACLNRALNRILKKRPSPEREIQVRAISVTLTILNQNLRHDGARFSSEMPVSGKLSGLIDDLGRGRRAFQNPGRMPLNAGTKPSAMVKIHG